eukprot:CAMPEP_0205948604 /NCGR_PEP_ID=MMETSP1459-20131121/889_1 /ASSEMBLY_ACC=CAM_ASM_001120 /TAXON_ID=41880 /ORGANISM="Pycnococcus provasolii, Strain RCC931" /LENGTH=127 /DNA_ID=CAMNT_0053319937 /DNA_START=21 /DNA_END=404 /DNA_ORIENTATION=+
MSLKIFLYASLGAAAASDFGGSTGSSFFGGSTASSFSGGSTGSSFSGGPEDSDAPASAAAAAFAASSSSCIHAGGTFFPNSSQPRINSLRRLTKLDRSGTPSDVPGSPALSRPIAVRDEPHISSPRS